MSSSWPSPDPYQPNRDPISGSWHSLRIIKFTTSHLSLTLKSHLNTNTVKVTEIPPNFTYERYEEHLNNLVEKRIINSYEDNSSDKIEYILKFQRAVLKQYITKNKLDNLLKIHTSETENLTTIDENGKLKIFNRVEEIVQHFVQVRLKWYQKRKEYLIAKT